MASNFINELATKFKHHHQSITTTSHRPRLRPSLHGHTALLMLQLQQKNVCMVLPKFDPFITGIRHSYKYRDVLLANCSSEWSSPAARLTWYINNKTAPQSSLQPQINEITRNIEGFPLYASNLQLRVHIDDQRFISKSEVLELRCTADIMALANLRRESRVRTTILALKDNGYNQRFTENGTCASVRAATFAAWLLCVASLLPWHCTLS